MIGRLLSGRYRIEAVVGTGGMAVVYRALDTQENRTVAIKVLRTEYESDMEFVRRFSREAEAAAKVFHENIVNMLDVGIDDEMRYIVMEYVDGQTLKEMIRSEGKIHPDVALRMTIRILAAVDHAHRNGIVHRDIKPQNILVDKEGRVKVADFGIARLKTSQTTQVDANGSAMGSVHYLSPEQARGEVADEQSDLYSVGVVMYEMLTGHVPFDGDTPISVALKHVSETPKSMRAENSKISRALDEVVMRALCKDKTRRYQTAAEMAADLRKTISHPKGGFVRYPAEEGKTAVSRTEKLKRSIPKPNLKKIRKRVVIWIAAGVLLLFILISQAIWWFGMTKMPKLIGLGEAEAVAVLDAMQIPATVVSAYSDDYPAGMVMLQSKDADTRLRKNTSVTLTVSRGSQWYYLEDMTGWMSEDAINALAAQNVASINVSYVQSDDLPVGRVISMDAEPGWISRDTPVNIKISGQSVTVPLLTGLTLDGARAVIEAEGLCIGTVSEGEAADAESGTVIGQSIAPYSQVLTGAEIDLTICGIQEDSYAPASPLMLVVPLENVRVSVNIITPSGQSIEAFVSKLASGTHWAELSSPECGRHSVYVYMDDVLMESMVLDFE